MLIRELLDSKTDTLLTILPDADLRESAELMIDQSVSALIVLTETGQLAGILTERDVAHYLAVHPGGAPAKVSDAMTQDLITCTPEHPVSEIAKIMSDNTIRHLPVVVGDGVIGIVSIRDVVRFRLSALETENQTLRELVATLD